MQIHRTQIRTHMHATETCKHRGESYSMRIVDTKLFLCRELASEIGREGWLTQQV